MGFDTFWKHYPRRVAKKAAQRAFDKAIREGATVEEIIAGVVAYLEYLPSDRQFIPHPATWLNGGRWEDEYQPADSAARRKSLNPKRPVHNGRQSGLSGALQGLRGIGPAVQRESDDVRAGSLYGDGAGPGHGAGGGGTVVDAVRPGDGAKLVGGDGGDGEDDGR